MYGVLKSCLFALTCLYTNRTSKELQTLLCLFFFSKFEPPNRGCGLSMGAAYTWNFTVLVIVMETIKSNVSVNFVEGMICKLLSPITTFLYQDNTTGA